VANELVVRLVGDTKDLEKALGRASRTSQSSFSKIGKAAGVAAAAIGVGLAAAAKIGFDELSEQQKVAAQTAAVLESTGGAAKVTAKDVENLASSLSDLSGVDDELIASSENVLLTFTSVRNEVGKGNKIFDRATATILDMSEALGTDLQGATIQVGKALQDPVRGLTALRRVGVNFTKEQEKRIKAFVKEGEVLKAQKLILRELNKEFGGSAKAAGETLPGQLAKLRNSFEEVAGELTEALLPAFTFLIDKLGVAADFLQKHPKIAKAVVIGLASIAVALTALSAASTVATVATIGLTTALAALGVVLVIPALIAAAAALAVLYQRSEKFRAAVDFLRKRWQLLLFAFGVLPGVIAMIVKNWDKLRAGAMRALNPIISAVQTLVSWVRQLVSWVNAAVAAVGRLAAKIPSIPRLPDLTPGFSIPGFAKGGVVPGPVGAPRLAVVHGGETVLPTHQRTAVSGGGTGQFALLWAGPDFIRWAQQQDSAYRRGNGGRGIFGG
jgi:hypothetical protein